MKDNRTEEIEVTANTAEAENKQEVAAGPKKFKDVQALIDAYTALEAEFTRRSQRLKELEANKEQASSAQTANAQATSAQATTAQTATAQASSAQAATAQATSEAAPSQAKDTGRAEGVHFPIQRAEEGVRPLTVEEKNAVIEEYLSGLYSNRSVPFVMAGGAVKAARTVPKTISEAGSLAKKYFEKKEN